MNVVVTPVLCVVEHLHRSRRVADDAARGRFTHAGITLEVGLPPDWVGAGLVDDDEWRIEWVKLYEGLDLAAAYDATGNARYWRTWTTLVESFCAQVAVGHDTSDVTARRVQNWIYAAQRFQRAGAHVTPSFAACFRRRLVDDLAYIRSNLTSERNHRTLELYALLIGALALDDRASAGSALELLADNADSDIWSDGTHRECSSDYHHIVTRSFVGAIRNAAASGLAVPARLRTRTLAALEFGMHLQAPDGTTPALSDSDRADFRRLYRDAAECFDRADFRWVASRGGAGSPPEQTDVVFATSGYVVQRSGWGSGPTDYALQCHAVFDCGPLGDGGHGHYDHLAVELFGPCGRIAVDPGRYTYADCDARQWFKGTAAHNTVTVDGLDQVEYRRGRPKGPRSHAVFVGRDRRGGILLDVGAASSPRYDAEHRRGLLFVDNAWWIVHDRLRDAVTHRYEARWHLDPEAGIRVSPTRVGDSWVVRARGATLWFLGAHAVDIEAGWVSETYGVRAPAPVVVARADRARADLVTLVVPDGAATIDLPAAHAMDDDEFELSVTVNARPMRVAWSTIEARIRRVER